MGISTKHGTLLSGDVTQTTGGVATIQNNSVDGTDIAIGSDATGDLIMYNGTDWVRLAKDVGPGLGRAYTKIIGSFCAPVGHLDGNAGAVATGADTSITNVNLGNGYPNMVIYNTGTNDGNELPVVTVDAAGCDGLALPSTNTNNIGGTITFGASLPNLCANGGAGPTLFKVGTDPAFYCELRISFPKIAEYDVFAFGFVEPANAYVAAIDSQGEVVTAYDEKAMFCLADNAGDMDVNTSLAGSDANADLSTTDIVDDAIKTFRVSVSSAGVTTYRWWDGAAEDTSVGGAAFTFADTTILTPCIIFAKCDNSNDLPPIMEYIEWGYQ